MDLFRISTTGDTTFYFPNSNRQFMENVVFTFNDRHQIDAIAFALDDEAIAGILSKYGISIESVIQKGRQQSEPVAIVISTHTAQEASVVDALAEIDGLEVVSAPTVKIRMLDETVSFEG
jgi:siroheme synthase